MKKKRIFHGPAAVGGMGWHLAEYQRQKGFVSDSIVYQDNGFRQLYHVHLRLAECSRVKRYCLSIGILIYSLINYDIFHFYYGNSFIKFGLDLPLLKLFRKKILMTYCGSDIRLIEIERSRNDYIHLFDSGANSSKMDKRKKFMMCWQNLWIDKFFAIRELFDYAEHIIPENKIYKTPWLNNIGFDGRNIIVSPGERIIRDKVHLVHAPSNKNIKGTEYVAKAIAELRKRGLKFKYTELHGVPNSKVQETIQESDVIIDQFLVGSIGTFAFEGMGLGKPVVAYLSRGLVEAHMPDCPIYEANIENLADRLQNLINDPELRIELGNKGIQFCKKYLDYDDIQQGVINIYEQL